MYKKPVTPTFFIYLKTIFTPKAYTGKKLQSKRFFDEETVRDFPIRVKACYLKTKCRKWSNEDTGKIVYRNWEWNDGKYYEEKFSYSLDGSRPLSYTTIRQRCGSTNQNRTPMASHWAKKQRKLAEETKVPFVAVIANGDTLNQLLARGPYLLFKKQLVRHSERLVYFTSP